jgi:hypothetical protein
LRQFANEIDVVFKFVDKILNKIPRNVVDDFVYLFYLLFNSSFSTTSLCDCIHSTIDKVKQFVPPLVLVGYANRFVLYFSFIKVMHKIRN